MNTFFRIVSGGAVVALAFALSATAFAQAELEVRKTPNTLLAGPGSTITYTIVVSNTGDENATGVTVTDTFDDDMDFVSSTSAPETQSGNTATWDLGTVEANTSKSITVTVRLDSSFTGPTVDLTGNKVLINHVEADAGNGAEVEGLSAIEGSVTGGVSVPPPSGGGLPTTGIPVVAAVILAVGALLGTRWAFAANRW